MLTVKQFRYSADNLGYLVYGQDSGMAVDGGAANEMLSYLSDRRLSLRYIVNTHNHSDHTSGNEILLAGSRARLLEEADLPDGGVIPLAGENIVIIHTPGHSADSRSFHTGEALLTGDTLFNGTIGNCFSGDPEGFYRSIRKLMAFSDETLIYAGHDYVSASLAFAKRLEPGNRAIDDFLERYDRNHVVSTLAEERKINPYLRFNHPDIVTLLSRLGLPRETEWERWQSLMGIE